MMRTNGWGWRFSRALGAILPLLLAGRPEVSLAADVHDIHAPSGVVKARPCSDCHTGSRHNSTTQSGGSGTIDVPGPDKFYYMNGNADSDGAYNATSKACTNVDCHFGPGNAGTTNDVQNTDPALKCGTCHPDTADVDDFGYGNNTMAKIATGQWDASGHGATGTLPSGNAGANFAGPASDPEGCAYSHDSNVPHGNDSDTLNPFRLANNNALGHGWIDVCLVCHSSGDSGYDPDGSGSSGYLQRGHTAANQGKAADANHYGPAHEAGDGTDGGKFCWDCHDPHGDRSGSTGNIFMVQSAVSKASDGTYGRPAVNGTAAVTFTRETIDDIAEPGYYVVTNSATGLCQVCHTYSGSLDSGEVKYWRNDQTEHVNGSNLVLSAASRHNADAVCTSCHQHKNEFSAGCTDCHGNSDAGSRWPDGIANNGATRSAYADDAGAHQKHVDAIYTYASGGPDLDKKNNTCVWCHPGNPPPGHPNDSVSGASQAEVTRMDTGGNGFSGPPSAGDYWAFGGGATATSGTAVYYKTISGTDDTDAYISFAGGARTCYNTDCHGGSASPAWYAGADTTKPTVSNVLTNGSATLTITQGTAAITLTALAADAANVIVAGEYFVGSFTTSGNGTPMGAADGAFDEKTDDLTATVDTSLWTSSSSPYTLYVDAKDAANNWGPTSAASVLVSVAAQDSFTVAHLDGSAENVSTGAANVVMQRLAFTATGAVDLLTVTVLGTRTGGGDVAVDVAQVKICLDDGDGAWEGTGTDTVIGSGFLNATTKNVTIDIADQAIPNGATRYLYIVYDVAGNASGGDVLGAQLTALTYGPTDSLGTALPLPSPAHDNKTVVVSGDTLEPSVGTLRVNGSAAPSIQEETATVTLTAVATDSQNIIAAAEYFDDGGTQIPHLGEADPGLGAPMSTSTPDAHFNSTSETVTATVDTSSWRAVDSTTPRVYTIYVDARDAAGNWGPASAATIAVTVTPKDVVTVTGTPQP